MYIIIVEIDGKFLPIMSEEDSTRMAVFSSFQDAQDYANGDSMCQVATTYLIDLNDAT